jgi:nicotinamide riboside transporter PnuC
MPIDVGRIFEYTAVVFNIIGSMCIAQRDRRGYAVFIAGFVPSAAFAIYYRHWGMLTLYIYFLLVNCYGYQYWRRHEK